MDALFWLALVVAAYSYFIYPLLLLLLPPRRAAAAEAASALPAITFIITAHNEAARIAGKLENTLAIDYPPERRQIIVASDASTDETDRIVEQFADRGVRLVRSPERLGKEAAQRRAIQSAEHDLLVFSDVATRITGDSLQALVRNFADPAVGAVSSDDRFVDAEGRIVGEGLYVRYEMWLRRLESRATTLVGLSGSFFAARRAVCEAWDTSVPSDLNTALNCVRLGLVAVSEPRALGYYPAVKQESDEYRRKVRTVMRGMAALWHRPELLNPFRFGLFAWQLWSHKVMRWAVPLALVALLPATLVLATSAPLYALALAGQLLFYGAAAIAWRRRSGRTSALLRVPLYFVLANMAIVEAAFRFVRGQRILLWEPSRR